MDFSWSKTVVLWRRMALFSPSHGCVSHLSVAPALGTVGCARWGQAYWSAWKLTQQEKMIVVVEEGERRRTLRGAIWRPWVALLSPEPWMLQQTNCTPQQSWVGTVFRGPTLPAKGVEGQIGCLIFAVHNGNKAEWEGGAKEGRFLVCLVPTKGWWWPTEEHVKFGWMQHAELIDSACIHQTFHSWRYPLYLGWCFWSTVEM